MQHPSADHPPDSCRIPVPGCGRCPCANRGHLKGGRDRAVHGTSSDFGVQMLQGIQLATEEINAVGGYMGRPPGLVIKDD